MSETSRAEDPPPLTQTRQFWVLLGYAVALGVLGALASLMFMGVIGFGDNWYVVANSGWFGGQWWWIAVTAAAGVVVGLLRRATRLPEHTPGLIADLQAGRVEPRLVPGIVAVSAVSLIGGASLGPEQALGSIGGGAGSWVSRRRRLGAEDSQVNTLAGFGGAYGGLFSSTVIVVMMIMEVARPGGRRFTKALVGAVVASSVSFAVYFAIAGAVFLDAYPVPHYQFEDWQLLAAVPLGLFAAVVTTLLGTFVKLSAMLFDRLKLPGVVKSTLGGAIFGLVGVALPLTLFTGSDQLNTVITDAGTLGLGLLVALLIGKMLTFAVSQASGFIGGPIFPALFIGGTAGVLVHHVFPGLPLGLTFTCMLAAVPGSLIAAPFSMVLLGAFLTAVGALQTAPILIAVLTAFLTMEGIKYLLTRRQHPRAATGEQEAAARPTSRRLAPSCVAAHGSGPAGDPGRRDSRAWPPTRGPTTHLRSRRRNSMRSSGGFETRPVVGSGRPAGRAEQPHPVACTGRGRGGPVGAYRLARRADRDGGLQDEPDPGSHEMAGSGDQAAAQACTSFAMDSWR